MLSKEYILVLHMPSQNNSTLFECIPSDTEKLLLDSILLDLYVQNLFRSSHVLHLNWVVTSTFELPTNSKILWACYPYRVVDRCGNYPPPCYDKHMSHSDFWSSDTEKATFGLDPSWSPCPKSFQKLPCPLSQIHYWLVTSTFELPTNFKILWACYPYIVEDWCGNYPRPCYDKHMSHNDFWCTHERQWTHRIYCTTVLVIALAHKEASSISSQPALWWGHEKASRAGQGCVFHRRKTHGVATNVYWRNTSEKPKRRWSAYFENEGSGVVYARGRY